MKSKSKSIRLYNLIFPVWAVLLIPKSWIAVIPLNIIVDFLVSILGYKIAKVEKISEVLKKSLAKTIIFGFLADLIASGLLLVFTFGTNSLMPHAEAWWTQKVSTPLLNNPFESIYATIVMILVVAFAGFLVYLFNRKFSFRNTELTDSQIKKISLTIAIITTPYLFLVPMEVIFKLFG